MLMRTYDMQLANEYKFARAHIDKYMRDYVLNDEDVIPLLDEGVKLLTDYVNTEYSYDSKNRRVEAVRSMNLRDIVIEITVASAYAQQEELLATFAAKIAGILKFDDKVDSVTTVAEMIVVLCETNLYDLNKSSKFDSWYIVSNIELSHELEQFIENSAYLPPLVHPPEPLKHNRQSAYLTVGLESVILNKGHHDGDVCLDVINIMNSVPLSLHTGFLSRVEEEPNTDITALDKATSWLKMKAQSHEMYKLMVGQGNRFCMSYNWDRRGRGYAKGYHISPQGSPYKKAMLEFADKEVVEGCPQEFML